MTTTAEPRITQRIETKRVVAALRKGARDHTIYAQYTKDETMMICDGEMLFRLSASYQLLPYYGFPREYTSAKWERKSREPEPSSTSVQDLWDSFMHRPMIAHLKVTSQVREIADMFFRLFTYTEDDAEHPVWIEKRMTDALNDDVDDLEGFSFELLADKYEGDAEIKGRVVRVAAANGYVGFLMSHPAEKIEVPVYQTETPTGVLNPKRVKKALDKVDYDAVHVERVRENEYLASDKFMLLRLFPSPDLLPYVQFDKEWQYASFAYKNPIATEAAGPNASRMADMWEREDTHLLVLTRDLQDLGATMAREFTLPDGRTILLNKQMLDRIAPDIDELASFAFYGTAPDRVVRIVGREGTVAYIMPMHPNR